MTRGPIEILVFGFQGGSFNSEILPALRILRNQDLIRLIDLLAVAKDDGGHLQSVQSGDLSPEEAEEFGAITSVLVGLRGPDVETSGDGVESASAPEIADAIPAGGTAAIAILEHRWAVPLLDAIARAGGATLADLWIDPSPGFPDRE